MTIFAAGAAEIRPASARLHGSCEDLLAGQPLLIVSEKSLERRVIDLQTLKEFAASIGWYNPYDRVTPSLFSGHFQKAFASLSAGMTAGERADFKRRLSALLEKRAALGQIVEESAIATQETFVFEPLPGPDLHEYEQDSSAGFAFAMVDGRPQFMKPMLHHGRDPKQVLYDPFAAEPELRLKIFEGIKQRDQRDVPAFLRHGNKTYLIYRQGLAFDLENKTFSPFDLPTHPLAYLAPETVMGVEGEVLLYKDPVRIHWLGRGSVSLGKAGGHETSASRIGGYDIVAVFVDRELHFFDLGRRETLQPFRFTDGSTFGLGKAAVFEQEGKLLAAIPSNELTKDNVHRQGITVWDLRKGEVVQFLPVPFAETVRAVRDGEKTFLVFTLKNEKAGFIPLEGGTYTPLSIGKFGVEPFHALGREFIGWASGNSIFIYDLRNQAMTSAQVPGLLSAGMMKTFERDGVVYAVVDDQYGFPLMVQLTGAAK